MVRRGCFGDMVEVGVPWICQGDSKVLTTDGGGGSWRASVAQQVAAVRR